MEPSPEVPGDNGQEIVVVRIYKADRKRLQEIGRKADTYPEILRAVICHYTEGEKEQAQAADLGQG